MEKIREIFAGILMPDSVSPGVRSRIMRSIHSTGNVTTEIRLASMMRASGLLGWRRHARIAGSIPDFVFLLHRLAVFVDGCFWHGCPIHFKPPASNQCYWGLKIAGNRERDRAISARLGRAGWKPMRIWEHELDDAARTVGRIASALGIGNLNVNRASGASSRPR